MADKRTDRGSLLIAAPPEAVFAALVDPEAVARWRPPEGMAGKVHHFDARPGGAFRMSFHYLSPDHGAPGKTSQDVDTFAGAFLAIDAPRRLVEEVIFDSDDPVFAEPMRVITTLEPEADGTRVTVTMEDVPAPISPEDHAAGIASSLANLAQHVERRR